MKLAGHSYPENLTRVDDNKFIDSSDDSSYDMVKTEKAGSDLSEESQLPKSELEKLPETEGNDYIGLKGLEADYRQFKP